MNNNRTKFQIALIKMPVFREEETKFLFIGPALINSVLREAGYILSQIELDAISRRKGYYYQLLYSRLDELWSYERVMNYLHGAMDYEIEKILLHFLDDVHLENIDFVLLSTGLYDGCSSLMTLCFAKYIKHHFNVRVIIGGEASGLTGSYEPIYKILNELAGTECFDYYIRGYGEDPLLDLFTTLEFSGSPGVVPGVYYFDSEKKITGVPPSMEYKVRLPDFQGFIDEWHIWKPSLRISRLLVDRNRVEVSILPVKLIYGCPNNCTFCVSSKMKSKKFMNHINPSEFAEGIMYLKQTFDTKYFFFCDDIFNISPSFVTEICNELLSKKANILWTDCAQFRGWTKDLLHLAREAGCIRLYYGLETASPRMQPLVNKNVDLAHAEKVLRWSHDIGIFNGLEIISGLPTETDEDINDTLNFIMKNSEYIDEVTLNAFYLVDGSLMFQDPAKYGIENIRQIRTLGVQQEKAYHPLQYFAFDEIDGLKWQEKRKQIDRSTGIIWNFIFRNKLHELREDGLHVLFALYDRWNNKSEVRKRYLALK